MSVIHVEQFQWHPCNLYIAATANGICRIEFARELSFHSFVDFFSEHESVTDENEMLIHFRSELTDYLGGKKIQFSTPVDFLKGTLFQRSVWNHVKNIPYGQVQTYGQIAKKLENPGAVRAVGAANGANPVPILVPCHRIIQSNGKLGGYSGGLDIKDALLRLEGVLF